MKSKATSSRPQSGRSTDSNKGTKKPRDVLLSWPGTLSRFDRLREGGPGRPFSLAIMLFLGLVSGYWGADIIDNRGIDSAGPVLVFLSGAWLLFLIVWVLIKAGLRDIEVAFYLSENGVGIIPSPRQKRLDRNIGILSRILFLLTLKGGQWSAWQPYSPWKSVRGIEINKQAREILISGGSWDIRLVCTRDNFTQALELVMEKGVV